MANRPDIGDVFMQPPSELVRVGLHEFGGILTVGILEVADSGTYIRYPFGSFDSRFPYTIIKTMSTEEMRAVVQRGLDISCAIEDLPEEFVRRMIQHIGTRSHT